MDWYPLPPIVIGPMIIIIGLGLANSAVTNAGFVTDGDWKQMLWPWSPSSLRPLSTPTVRALVPFLPHRHCRRLPGFHCSWHGRFYPSFGSTWFELPGFILPFKLGSFQTFELYFGPEMLAILPISIVTVAEYIGDHTVLSHICGREFLKNLAWTRTLIGDLGWPQLSQPSWVDLPTPPMEK